MAFRVTNIIDGDTFDVSPSWKWKEQSGKRIRPTGYDAPEIHTRVGQQAKLKLAQLILNEEVELKTAHTIDRGRLVCDVYFKGQNLANYFAAYRV